MKKLGDFMKIGAILALGALAISSLPAAADEAAVRQSMAKLIPTLPLKQVVLSPVAGIYEVTAGPHVFYVSEDGRYLLRGNLIDVNTRENLTEVKLGQVRKEALKNLSEDQMVVFSPENPKHTITVFTDIDCGYCRKLHSQIDDYMKEGIKVRYLLFPRAGVDSASYKKAVNVWCAADRKQALTDAKAGKNIPELTCDNPVKEHMALGELMGVTGTPTMVLEDGNVLPGYVPPKRMAEYLDKAAK